MAAGLVTTLGFRGGVDQESCSLLRGCCGASRIKAGSPWCVRPKLDDELEFSSVDASHLSATVRNAEPVRIAKIQNLHGVNGLADGAALGVALQGITIIAGKNGSGKSGYTRILKQVAASRASEEVLPNAFEQKPKPTAVVSYQLGNALAQELAWTADSERTESPLQRVRVFDSGAARAQVAGSTEVAYVPRLFGSSRTIPWH